MAEGIQLACIVVGLICGVTSLIDMGMNGSRFAEWAPIGLPVVFVCMAVYALASLGG